MRTSQLSTQTKWVGLSTLLAIWIGLLYVMVIDVPPPIEVPLKYQSGQPATRAQQPSVEETWEVHSLRAQSRALPVTPTRNIFSVSGVVRSSDPANSPRAQGHTRQPLKAVASVPPSPPPPPTQEELARQQAELAAQAARQQQELAVQVARQQEEIQRQQLREQMAQYRYLGYVNQNGVHKAFLGKGRDIYIIREGDTLDGKFQVALIEATLVKLFEAESKLETTLNLKKEEGAAPGA